MITTPGKRNLLGSESEAASTLNPGTRWRWVVSFMLGPLDPQYSFHTRFIMP